MAQRAGLIFLRLVVEAGKRWSGLSRSRGVAYQAKQIDLAAPQKFRVCRSVWRMAGTATFRAQRRMFHCKRTGLAGVASEAHRVTRCARANLALIQSAMRIVAIATANQTLIHAMVHRVRKIRLDRQMACETQS